MATAKIYLLTTDADVITLFDSLADYDVIRLDNLEAIVEQGLNRYEPPIIILDVADVVFEKEPFHYLRLFGNNIVCLFDSQTEQNLVNFDEFSLVFWRKPLSSLTLLKHLNFFKHYQRTPSEYVGFMRAELKNPLTSILGWSEALHMRQQMKMSEEQIEKSLKTIHSDAIQIREILSMLAVETRLAAGTLQLAYDWESVMLHEQIQKHIKARFESGDAIVNVNIQSDLKVLLPKPTSYEDYFSNSLKDVFDRVKQECHITAGLTANYAILKILVYGYHREPRLYVVDPFQSMYLYAFDKILTELGGGIRVEPHSEKGATFIFTLPIAQVGG